MPSPTPSPRRRGPEVATELLASCSFGVIGKDIDELAQVRAAIPSGTRVYVGFVDSEEMTTRLEAAATLHRSGLTPVPIIAARRLHSEGMLREYLSGLRDAGASGSVMVVGGDPAQPRGPYSDAASVIGSGLLEEYGVREVGLAGYPGGHPVVPDGALWQALADKAATLQERGLSCSVVTQFEFDAALVLGWLARVRAGGKDLPVHVGVPGPAAVRVLLAYASWSGVRVSASVAEDYGFSLTDPTGTAGPGRFIRALAAGFEARLHGEVTLCFNCFEGLAATAEWVRGFRSVQGDAEAGG